MSDEQPGGVPPAAPPPSRAPATRSRGAPAPADPPPIKEAALSPRARAAKDKPAAKAPARAPARAPAARSRKAVPGKGERFVHHPPGPDLKADLRAFVQARPGGWGHDDWVAFLDHLREQGHDTSDPDGLGLALERERLAASLERVQGMGPRRVEAVVQRYDTLWSARQADVEELCRLPGMNRSLAEKVRQALLG